MRVLCEHHILCLVRRHCLAVSSIFITDFNKDFVGVGVRIGLDASADCLMRVCCSLLENMLCLCTVCVLALYSSI